MNFANEDTEETCAKRRLGHEIVRYVDAAIALARSVKSESAGGFVLVKSLFEKYDGDFSQAEHSIAVKTDFGGWWVVGSGGRASARTPFFGIILS